MPAGGFRSPRTRSTLSTREKGISCHNEGTCLPAGSESSPLNEQSLHPDAIGGSGSSTLPEARTSTLFPTPGSSCSSSTENPHPSLERRSSRACSARYQDNHVPAASDCCAMTEKTSGRVSWESPRATDHWGTSAREHRQGSCREDTNLLPFTFSDKRPVDDPWETPDHRRSLASVREEEMYSFFSPPAVRSVSTPLGTPSRLASSVSPIKPEGRRNAHVSRSGAVTSAVPTQLAEWDLLPLRKPSTKFARIPSEATEGLVSTSSCCALSSLYSGSEERRRIVSSACSLSASASSGESYRSRALRRNKGAGTTMRSSFQTSESLDARPPPSAFFEAPSPAHPPRVVTAARAPPARGESTVAVPRHGRLKTGDCGGEDGEALGLFVSPTTAGRSRRRGSQVPRSVRTQRLSAGALALLHDRRENCLDNNQDGRVDVSDGTGFFPFCPRARAASFVRHVQAEATYGCYPIWTLRLTLWICLVGSALFLALGILLLAEDEKHVECKLNYEDETLQEGGSRYSLINLTPEHCGQRGDTLVLKGPYIYVYVEMEGFFQNDAQVVWSRNERQLAGEIFTKAEDLASCEPVVTAVVDNETKVLHPCGVLAWNVFTDRFQFLDAEPDDAVDSGQIKPLVVEQSPSVLLNSINWRKHFRNPPLEERAKHRGAVYFWMSQVDNDDGEDMYKSREEAKAELLNDRLNYEEAGDMVENGHFIQWMYVSTFSSWRKLYGRIRGPIELPIFAYIAVTYDVKLWRGKKAIVLVQPSLFGGRTQFIGIVYIVFACILAIFATYMLWKRFFRKEEYANEAFKDIRWKFNRKSRKKLK